MDCEGWTGQGYAREQRHLEGCRLSMPWLASSTLRPARAEEDRTLLGLNGRRISRCERSLALAHVPSCTGPYEAGY